MPMFYAGECVKSKWHGYAEVVESGEDPVVAFLHGEPVRVEGDSLKVVPPWMYERAQ